MLKNLLILLFFSLSVILFLFLERQNKEVAQPQVNVAVESMEDAYKNSNTEPNVTDTKVKSSLDLSGQNLDSLPKYVLSRTDLEKLDISNNKLSGALPAEIRHLQNLKVLDASDNNMTGVPAEVGQLTKLEVLDLSNNQLTGLPNELANLKNLKVFNLSGNNYSQQDLEKIKEGLPSDVELIL